MGRNLIILLLIALLTGCEDEPTIRSREYAVVQTEVIEITSTGVRLGARVLARGKSEISHAGFIFGTGGQPGYRIVVEDFSDNFEYYLRRDIAEGERFFVKAYVVSDDTISYGNIEFFQSQGFKKPPAVVEQIIPQNVSDGFKVMLIGQNFSLMPGMNQVSVGGEICQIYYTGFDTIGFITPSMGPGSHTSYLEMYDKKVEFGPMIVKLPEITSFEPQEGFDGTDVTIRGKYFGTGRRVTFGSANGILIYTSDTLIIARVPNSTQTGPVSLKVEITGKQSIGGEQFTIFNHSVTGLSVSSGKVGERIVIYGSMFRQPQQIVRVFFDNIETRIQALNDDRIEVNIPDVTSVNPLIRVFVGSKEANISGFSKIDSWQKIGDFPGGPRADMVALAVNSDGYVGLGSAASGALMADWWKFTPGTETWTRLSDFPGAPRYHTVSFAIENKIYVGYGTGNSYMPSADNKYFNDFWAYDIDTDQWSKIADPPMSGSVFYDLKNASAIADNQKGYVKLYNKLFIYDPLNNQWTVYDSPEVAVSGYYTDRPFSLKISDRYFWFFGFQAFSGTNTRLVIYEYSPALNSWTPFITHYNLPIKDRPVSFVLNNEGIFGGGTRSTYLHPDQRGLFWRFDPDTYELIQLEGFYQPCASQAGFEINGKGYIGLGSKTTSTPSKEFFIFDPN